jgi:hypothetical protein
MSQTKEAPPLPGEPLRNTGREAGDGDQHTSDLRQTVEFIETVYGRASGGWIHLTKTNKQVSALAVDDLQDGAAVESFAAEIISGTDVYLTATVQREKTGSGGQGRTSDDDAHQLTSLWSDIDRAGAPGHKREEGLWTLDDFEALLDELEKNGIPPTAVVDSGGGWWLWWVLEEPLTFGTDGQAEDLLRRWASWWALIGKKADRVIDSVFNRGRIARAPGSTNNKEGIPRASSMVGLNGATVSLDKLGDLLADADPGVSRMTHRDGSGKPKLRRGTDREPKRIPDGERNVTLTSIAGLYRDMGMSPNEVYAALLVANEERCDPPLPDPEVERIARSIASYAYDATLMENARKWQEDVERRAGVEDSEALKDIEDEDEFIAMRRREAEAIDLADLLDRIESYWLDYVIFPTGHESVILSLWVVHSYVLDVAESTPYVHVTAPEIESGKTRVLEVARRLVRSPEFTSSVTPAVLFRLIDDVHPTLLIDEVDRYFATGRKSESSAEIEQLLNVGYERGNYALRSVKVAKEWGIGRFDTFTPKMMAGIRDLPHALQSRRIPIRLKRKLPDEMVEKFRARSSIKRAEPIRADLTTFSYIVRETAEFGCGLGEEPEVMPGGLRDRQEDIAEPLLVLAERAGGDWPQRAREAIVALLGSSDVIESGASNLLLGHIKECWPESDGEPQPAVFTRDLLAKLHAMDEAPWSSWGKSHQPLSPRDLAFLLRPYKINRRDVRVGVENRKGYRREDFLDAWDRYLGATSESSSQWVGVTRQTENVTLEVTPKESTSTRDVTHVTHVTQKGSVNDIDEPLPSSISQIEIEDGITRLVETVHRWQEEQGV